MRNFLKFRFQRRGLSLVELAIVLAVIGSIMAVIWSYASSAFENARREQVVQEHFTVVNNIRGAYTGLTGVPTKGIAGLVPLLIQNHTIPSEMARVPATTCTGNPTANGIPQACADTPWGPADPSDGLAIDPNGTFRVCDWSMGQTGCNANCPNGTTTCTTSAQYFAVLWRNISIGACIQLTEALSGPAGPPGLREMNVNGCNVISGIGCTSYTPTPALPVSAGDATALCTLPSNANIIRLVYSLRLPLN